MKKNQTFAVGEFTEPRASKHGTTRKPQKQHYICRNALIAVHRMTDRIRPMTHARTHAQSIMTSLHDTTDCTTGFGYFVKFSASSRLQSSKSKYSINAPTSTGRNATVSSRRVGRCERGNSKQIGDVNGASGSRTTRDRK